MNIWITFLTVATLFIHNSFALPLDVVDNFNVRSGVFTAEFITTTTATTQFITVTTSTTTTTETTTTTVTTTTTTTTTTTLAPEVDREWEDLILAGPTVVNYLSLFMVLASRKDQTLVVPAEYTVKHFGTTRSLHAILSRIASDIQAAFKVATDDLIRTRASMDQIPDHIKAGLLLIQTAPKDLLSKLLPYTLRNVDRAASEGSAVAKPTLQRFTDVESLLDELVTLLGSISSAGSEVDADYMIEANAYANDIKTQWNLLVKLFKKLSQRADITQSAISNSFIDPIKQATQSNAFDDQKKRTDQLDKLISASIAIDQSSNLLDMMARTYSEISSDHMTSQIASSKTYLSLSAESTRITSQRQLWQNTIAQSVKVARIAQERQDKFAETSPDRHTAYATYLQGVLSA